MTRGDICRDRRIGVMFALLFINSRGGGYPKAHSTGGLAVITAGLLAVPGREDRGKGGARPVSTSGPSFFLSFLRSPSQAICVSGTVASTAES